MSISVCSKQKYINTFNKWSTIKEVSYQIKGTILLSSFAIEIRREFFRFVYFVSVFLFAKFLIFDYHYKGHRFQFN